MILGESQSSTARRTLSASTRLLSELRLDPLLFACLLAIALLGILILYSASGQNFAMARGQFLRLVLGLVTMLILARVAPKYLRMFAPWAYVVGVLLLLVVAIVGDVGK